MKILYYFLNLTWGLILTTIGALVTLVLMLCGYEPKRHGGNIYIAIGDYWGGLELGLFFLTDKQENKSVLDHEFGHSFQNAIWGPLFLFVIWIPSAVRYWYRQYRSNKGNPCKSGYDDIWFEGQATEWGTFHAKIWDKK